MGCFCFPSFWRYEASSIIDPSSSGCVLACGKSAMHILTVLGVLKTDYAQPLVNLHLGLSEEYIQAREEL